LRVRSVGGTFWRMNPVPELNDARLYDLLERCGEEVRISARTLSRSVEEGGLAPSDLADPVRASAGAAAAIRSHLVHAVVVSLPKAEVESLARALVAIPVAAQRFAERLDLAGSRLEDVDFRPALGWIEELSEVVLDMIRQLRGFESLDRIKELFPRLETVADRAETLIEETVKRAYQRPGSPVIAMMVKDLGDRLQELIDFCRETGVVMNRISYAFL